ncbi:MAG TPA: HAMP domain-containing sensor histidine kinase [Polyangiaceae bacterium]|nr:HAMP domain-containing sensor histidine kinase [Polyangiaceae bacterium]
MLFEFITANREALVELTRAKIAKRLSPKVTEVELMSGVPLFLDQLVDTLRRPLPSSTETIDRGAAVHGAALLTLGYTVAQVVHDYGAICQAITELADSLDAPITIEEFQILNGCLDDAIAEAVTEYARLRERSMLDDETERSGAFAHELRNRIAVAQIAFTMIKAGRAPIGGSVASVVTRNLHAMTGLINRSLVEVRVDAGNMRRQRVQLHELIAEAEVDGNIEAGMHGVSLSVSPTDRSIEVEADPQILAGALANVLQNAYKFTHAGGEVTLKTTVVGARVEIDVEDQCGGLPANRAEGLFGAFRQHGTNRSGLGLGLFISRKGIEACDGVMRVRDVPGRGCVFTIDLPLTPPAT